jgi:hypothetical protein
MGINMWVEEISLRLPDVFDKYHNMSLNFEKNPDLLLLFGASDEISISPCLKKCETTFPDTLVVGCSTGTSIKGKVANDIGINGIALGFDNTKIRHSIKIANTSQDSFEVGVQLAFDLRADDLVAVFLMCDGLLINGSDIIEGMTSILGPKIPISGGLAGDGERFETTRVFKGGDIISNGAIAIGFYSNDLKVSHASFGGWYEFGPEWTITKSNGNIVEEIEYMPAIELYDDYVGTEKMALQASALLYPLKVWPPNAPEQGVVRAIMKVNRETGALTFAGDVPNGWSARLMHGNQRGLIDGATQAAEHAIASLKLDDENLKPDVCLIVSCVARRILLGSRTKNEIEAVSEIIGANTPMAGFYSYGEISPQNDSTSIGLHNQTMTLTLMSEGNSTKAA